MNSMFTSITAFAERWLGVALPQLFMLSFGVLLVCLIAIALWDRRISQLQGLLGILAGLLMAAISLQEVLASFIRELSQDFLIYLTATLLGIFLLCLTGFVWIKIGLRRRLKHVGGPVPDTAWTRWTEQLLHICRRPAKGTALAAPLIILAASASVFWVGMAAPQVMVGDEVVHYHMLETQAKELPTPNFRAEIPTGWGIIEERVYSHPFGWHYLGAVLFRLCGGSFAAVQLYQALYLTQLLGIAYLLARSRGGIASRAALPYLLTLASLPMTLIFTVTFYQDVPMAAQVLTAFFLLRKNRWLPASLFMAFALAVKVSAMLFFPAFFLCLLIWTFKRHSLLKTAAILACSLSIIALCSWGLNAAISTYASAKFYPVEKFWQLSRMVEQKIWPEKTHKKLPPPVAQQPEQEISSPVPLPPVQAASPPDDCAAFLATIPEGKVKVISKDEADVIANHPGDLRIAINYLIYGGLLLWLLALVGTAAALLQCRGRDRQYRESAPESSCWLWGTGLSYTFLAAFFLSTAPDARFFLPSLPFLILPFAEQVVRLPWSKWLISLLISLAMLQGGYVLAKTYHLRKISPDLREAIIWLRENPPQPQRIFMYPEGNYRLFPVPHDWYLRYHLRDFWKTDNDLRIIVLHRFRIGAIVIKKHLIAQVDEDITDLGVYPDYFVNDLRNDHRFRKLFENSAVVIFQTPDKSQLPEGADRCR